nr:envelope protein [White spot syndrome virus]
MMKKTDDDNNNNGGGGEEQLMLSMRQRFNVKRESILQELLKKLRMNSSPN